MAKLVIAEKPELARNIARAVCGAQEECPRLPYRSKDYVIVACAGHLLELAPPETVDPERWGRPWREESLPILPEPWPKVVAKGKERLVETIRSELDRCTSVIHAGDPDDEGQLIVDEILSHLGYDGKVERVLINDSIDSNIRRAFATLAPNDSYLGRGRSANARALADFCFGASESRLATIRAGHGRLLSIGRVQTPTLGLVVRRDENRARHVGSPYYVISARAEIDGADEVRMTLSPVKGALDDEGRLSDRHVAERARSAVHCASGLAVTTVTTSMVEPPLPYNLTELTAEMNRRHKMSARRVMEATQALRDRHRAITYNRTDCPYLPLAALDDAAPTLETAMSNLGAAWELDLTLTPRCFDDSKVDAHTAIVPQDMMVDMLSLSPDERVVYREIAVRYAAQFAGPAVVEVSRTELPCAAGTLVHRSKRVLSFGWWSVDNAHDPDEELGETWVDAGSHLAVVRSATSERRVTKPQPAYTEGTLVRDMASAAKFVEDPSLRDALRRKDEGKPGEHGSIGTTATRAQVIETLKRRGFVESRDGRITSTELGRALYAACPEDIRGVDTTARWWLIQEQVADGDVDEYAVARDVVRVFESHRGEAWSGAEIGGDGRVVGRCPRCGARVVDRGPGSKKYVCESNKWTRRGEGWDLEAGCGFELWKEQFGHKLTGEQAKSLIERGRTPPIRFRSKKSGRGYRARVVLESTGKTHLEFDDTGKCSRRS